jgi:hypothetical protein
MHWQARHATAFAQEAGEAISNRCKAHEAINEGEAVNGILSSAALVLLAATTVSGQPAAPKIDVTNLGPQVGERIADFRLQDQNGKVWTRDSLMGPNGLMLVFSRSADW